MYTITPVSIVDGNFKPAELYAKDYSQVGDRQIIFYPGEKVHVNECLQGLYLLESDLTSTDLKNRVANVEREEQIKESAARITEQQNEKDAEEKRNEIKNSSRTFNISETENEMTNSIVTDTVAASILYNYILKLRNGDGVIKSVIGYSTNRRAEDSSKPGNVTEYYKGPLRASFDKNGRLTDLRFEIALNYKMDASVLDSMAQHIRLFTGGYIKLENKNYPVGVYYKYHFIYLERETYDAVHIKKTKNKTKISDEKTTFFTGKPVVNSNEVEQYILNQAKIKVLDNGFYSVEVKKVEAKIRQDLRGVLPITKFRYEIIRINEEQ